MSAEEKSRRLLLRLALYHYFCPENLHIYSSALRKRFYHESKQYEPWSDCSWEQSDLVQYCLQYRLSKNICGWVSRQQKLWFVGNGLILDVSKETCRQIKTFKCHRDISACNFLENKSICKLTIPGPSLYVMFSCNKVRFSCVATHM